MTLTSLIFAGLVISGIVIEVSGTTAVQSYIFFIAGAICLIPGGKQAKIDPFN